MMSHFFTTFIFCTLPMMCCLTSGILSNKLMYYIIKRRRRVIKPLISSLKSHKKSFTAMYNKLCTDSGLSFASNSVHVYARMLREITKMDDNNLFDIHSSVRYNVLDKYYKEFFLINLLNFYIKNDISATGDLYNLFEGLMIWNTSDKTIKAFLGISRVIHNLIANIGIVLDSCLDKSGVQETHGWKELNELMDEGMNILKDSIHQMAHVIKEKPEELKVRINSYNRFIRKQLLCFYDVLNELDSV